MQLLRWRQHCLSDLLARQRRFAVPREASSEVSAEDSYSSAPAEDSAVVLMSDSVLDQASDLPVVQVLGWPKHARYWCSLRLVLAKKHDLRRDREMDLACLPKKQKYCGPDSRKNHRDLWS